MLVQRIHDLFKFNLGISRQMQLQKVMEIILLVFVFLTFSLEGFKIDNRARDSWLQTSAGCFSQFQSKNIEELKKISQTFVQFLG